MASAGEIMTTNIVAARPDMPVRDVAKLLLDHGISAAPVIDAAGNLLGIVSEGDLISRNAERTEKSRAWWLEMLADGFELAPRFVDYVRAHGPRAADVMTRDIITTTPETPAETIARLIERHRIKRVLVVRDGKFVGIVSRADQNDDRVSPSPGTPTWEAAVQLLALPLLLVAPEPAGNHVTHPMGQ
jgi:CBS domain-containing protein